MKRNGFTLIELLAVIVILAIIALIVTPIVLNIITSARKESNERSIEMYANAAKNAMARYHLETKKAPTSFSQIEPYIETSGSKVECGTSKINSDGSIYLAGCKVNGILVEEYTYGTEIICMAAKSSTYGTVPAGDGTFKRGDQYSCDPGDGVERTFYVVGYTDTEVSLLMNQNITTSIWIRQEDFGNDEVWNNFGPTNTEALEIMLEKGPVTALRNLKAETTDKGWIVEVSLPFAYQICGVVDTSLFQHYAAPLWAYENNDVSYITSTHHYTDATLIWGVSYVDYADESGCNPFFFHTETYGVRPVITVPKGQIK